MESHWSRALLEQLGHRTMLLGDRQASSPSSAVTVLCLYGGAELGPHSSTPHTPSSVQAAQIFSLDFRLGIPEPSAADHATPCLTPARVQLSPGIKFPSTC